MTDALRKAAQQALEALDSDHPDIQLRAAITLRAALAQPEQEPVAWVWNTEVGVHTTLGIGFHKEAIPGAIYTPLYTAPPQRKPLTEQEICESLGFGSVDIEFVRIVERAHGIGET
jgi:hypothetical protein